MLEVAQDSAGQRIDNWLMRQFRDVPKSLIYRILRRGEVRVNKRRIKPGYRVQCGDLIRIPPIRNAARGTVASPPDQAGQLLLTRILFEDDDFLVLNKPSGMPVHAGSGLNWGLIDALRLARPELARVDLVHRLDRETSGCLLLAKSAHALRASHRGLRDGLVEKRYLALVRGRWQLGTHTERSALSRFVQRGGERMVEVNQDGQAAVSHFEPVTLLRRAALLAVRIETGRTHQIRVHSAHLGHPVAGDRRYGDPTFNRDMREFGLRRLFLHAHHLRWNVGSRSIDVGAPMEPDLASVLSLLEANDAPSR